MNFNSVIFTDEVEIMADEATETNLSIHFNGLYFDNETAINIKHELEPIAALFQRKGFHAKKVFKQKSDDNYSLMNWMTDIIIRNKIIWISFPFSKDSMKSPGLKPILEIDFPYMNYQKSNYRAMAFLLYFHSIHYYQEKNRIFNPKIRIYTDKDEYIKMGTMYQHDGIILSNIEKIISTTGRQEPFLYLSDLVSFMFGRVKSKIGKKFNDINNINVEDFDQLTKICLFNSIRIAENGLFKLLNFWDIMPREE